MRPQQVLLLGLMLLVPVLAFLFLKSFGTNRYALPFYLPERVDSTLVAGKWQRDTVFRQPRDLSLRDGAGRAVTGAQLRGRGLYVLSFFPPDCSGNCARLNSELVRVQERFRQAPRVRLASVAWPSDPADSTAALARFAESYGAIAGKWLFLSADKRTLDQLATEFQLPAPPTGGAADAAYRPVVVLVDRDGYVRGRYNGSSERDMNRLITEIDVLLYIYDHP